jgi:hypothetical protein
MTPKKINYIILSYLFVLKNMISELKQLFNVKYS